MIIGLVEDDVHWKNHFPSKAGISTTASPVDIMAGASKPDLSAKHIAYGQSAVVFTTTANTLKVRSAPAVSLKPTNLQGGYFLCLY